MPIEKTKTTTKTYYVSVCEDCGNEFPVRSIKSTDKFCLDCVKKHKEELAKEQVQFMIGSIITSVDTRDDPEELYTIEILTPDGRKIELGPGGWDEDRYIEWKKRY